MTQVLAVTSHADGSSWVLLGSLIALLLAIDLVVFRGERGEMSVRSAAIASIAWVLVSVGFAVFLALDGDRASSEAFLAGYLVEKSLSLDNVFVFLLVLNAFAVPTAARHRLLTWGILAALVLRGVFIWLGAAALSSFSWINFIFAALLVWTAWKMWQGRHDHGGEERLVEWLREHLPIDGQGAGSRLFRVSSGRLRASTAGAALLALIAADVLFAVDSVPAILAITSDTYIVFAANAFALMGLRPLFFLVSDLVSRLYYLKAALAVLLAFIGLKMVAAQFVGKVGPEISLGVIAMILATGFIASLVRNRRQRG